ncbi:MAG TPA: DUF885 domain-containing protein [Streptosporangiaceae bacterium]|nr:DUF885 domain-containing protein [Streptosporangiaceae bacterium]
MNQPGNPVVALTDRCWAFLADHEFYLRLRAGLPVTAMPGFGADYVAGRAAFFRQIATEITALEKTELTPADQDTLGYLRGWCRRELIAERCYWLEHDLTPYRFSEISIAIDLVLGQFDFCGPEDADRYLMLVDDLGRLLEAVRDKVTAQAARGIRIAAAAVPGVSRTLSMLAGSLQRRLTVQPSRTARLAPARAAALAESTARTIDGRIIPAVGGLRELISPGYAASAPSRVGWAGYAGGDVAYRDFAWRETTVQADPEELHRVGLQQCAMLADRMREVRATLGFRGDEAEFNRRLEHEPRLYAASSTEIAQRLEAYITRIEPLLDEYFRDKPQTPYGVARLDHALEDALTFGYYEPATLTQPVGLYRFNGSNLTKRSLLTAAAVIYHELIPGHHFHVATTAESPTLPRLRREGFFVAAAFMEGWAEYAAGLGWEMGLYDDPWDAYGRLAQERLTATRLVVDTAMNLGRWDLEQARQFMRSNIADTEPAIRTESLRYATDVPGQALAYRVGYLKFAELRARASARLGTRFDLRDFHQAALGGGTVPLDVLTSRVDRYARGTPTLAKR